MVISSIDLKDGHVVQLKNGKDLVLQRDDADALINDFNFYGDVAVIDLDAAMGHTDLKGNTVNTPLLKSLLRKGNVRTGGGVRSVKRARELISLGAEKVIVGSAAFNKDAKGQYDILNKEFLQELCGAIGKQRVIISVDSVNGKIAVHGWKETLDIPLVAAAKAAEAPAPTFRDVCVGGKISAILYTFSASYGTGTFWISDDGTAYGVSADKKSTTEPTKDFECYSVYMFGLENPWVEGTSKQVAVGDDVIVKGQLTKYNTTYETASKKAWIYSLNGATE